MKNFKLAVIFLVLVLTVSALCVVSASGKDSSSALFELTLETNQEEYAFTEEIEATLTVKNISNDPLANVKLTGILPNGYKLKDGAKAEDTFDFLGPGESAELQVVYKPTPVSILLPIVICAVALILVVVIIMVVAKKKKSKRAPSGDATDALVSILLVLVMVASLVSGPLSMTASAAASTNFVEKTVKAGLREITLRGEVSLQGDSICTVTFNTLGGSAIEAQSFAAGLTPIVPESPTRDGYIFVGWYRDGECSIEYDFTEPINSDLTLYAKWVNVYLKVSQSEFYSGTGGTVYFYAQTLNAADSVYLVNAADNTQVIELKDDGKYSTSGDDLPHDNIYSGMLELSSDTAATFEYFAQVDGTENSQTVAVRFVDQLTDEQVNDIALVDQRIQSEIFEKDDYDSMSLEDRKTLTESVLKDLEGEGLILRDSITYNAGNYIYSFVYASGVYGSVVFKNWEEEEAASANGLYSVEPLGYSSMNLTLNVGEAIILWSFDQAWDSPNVRRPFYEETKAYWDDVGLNTTLVWDTTVEHYKYLKGYEMIIFSGHGEYTTYTYNDKSITCSSLCLHELATESKNQDSYSADLTQFRVGLISVEGGTMYAILPEFFRHYYDYGDLDGSFVFAENCESRGKDGNVNAAMVNALRSASVESVIGFHNTVKLVYARELMKTYVDALIEGNTTKEAYDKAIGIHGSNDSHRRKENDGPAAYPLFAGDEDSRLVQVGIENGSFEMDSTPNMWNQLGDVRVITGLNQLAPTDESRMVILSTGIGSAEQPYLDGEGYSAISQVFRVPSNVARLHFSYNMISEEPTEYIGSNYDDTFEVKLITENGAVSILDTSINTADWVKIDGINFDGGDDTVYYTQWQTVSFDMTPYAGEVVQLTFMVYDVGDSIYDTATLLDQIYLELIDPN